MRYYRGEPSSVNRGYELLPNGQVQMLGGPDGMTPWTRLSIGDVLQIVTNFSTGAMTGYKIAAIWTAPLPLARVRGSTWIFPTRSG